MFKLIKRLLKIEKVSEIKIQERYINHQPDPAKMKYRECFYKYTGIFYSTIVLNQNNVLINGYISYLLAKKYNKKYIRVERI